jgi:hypothetical protein
MRGRASEWADVAAEGEGFAELRPAAVADEQALDVVERGDGALDHRSE